MSHEFTISVRFFLAAMFTDILCVCCTISARPPRVARVGIVQCDLWHVYGLRAYNLFQTCITSRWARKPVQNGSLLPPHSRTKTGNRAEYGLCRFILDKMQTRHNRLLCMPNNDVDTLFHKRSRKWKPLFYLQISQGCCANITRAFVSVLTDPFGAVRIHTESS